MCLFLLSSVADNELHLERHLIFDDYASNQRGKYAEGNQNRKGQNVCQKSISLKSQFMPAGILSLF